MGTWDPVHQTSLHPRGHSKSPFLTAPLLTSLDPVSLVVAISFPSVPGKIKKKFVDIPYQIYLLQHYVKIIRERGLG